MDMTPAHPSYGGHLNAGGARRTMALSLGVDIGGTFTDVVLHDSASGRLVSAKVPTDYGDPIRGILAGKALLVDDKIAVAALSHATTLATNAPLPLIHRALRIEVAERIDARGTVVADLDEAALRAALAPLQDADVAAVA